MKQNRHGKYQRQKRQNKRLILAQIKQLHFHLCELLMWLYIIKTILDLDILNVARSADCSKSQE